MELRFLSPDLARLDEVDSEVLACSVWSDVRPSHGVAGLCDWRMAGHISALQKRGFVRGDAGEVVLLPGKPRMRFEKILLFGAGPRAGFDERVFESLLATVFSAMEGLGARACVIELPGRAGDAIAPERAADLLLASAGLAREHDVWTLVELPAARDRIMQHMIEERRRVRRIL